MLTDFLFFSYIYELTGCIICRSLGEPCNVGCSCIWRCSCCRSWDTYFHGIISLLAFKVKILNSFWFNYGLRMERMTHCLVKALWTFSLSNVHQFCLICITWTQYMAGEWGMTFFIRAIAGFDLLNVFVKHLTNGCWSEYGADFRLYGSKWAELLWYSYLPHPLFLFGAVKVVTWGLNLDGFSKIEK